MSLLMNNESLVEEITAKIEAKKTTEVKPVELDLNDNHVLYSTIFAKALDYAEKLVVDPFIRKSIQTALSKTLKNIKEGKLSPAIAPILVVKSLAEQECLNEKKKKYTIDLALDLSVICAYFHTSADVADDVEDEAENNDLINEIGKSQAINISNMLLFVAFEIITNLKITNKNKIKLFQLFSKKGKLMTKGQYYDLYSTNKALLNKDPFYISEKKAGEEFALFMSCFFVATGDKRAKEVESVGRLFGSLAQIFSDYFDIWCNVISEDLISLKQSLPISKALSDPLLGKKVRLLLAGKNNTLNKQADIKRLLISTTAIERFSQYIDYCKNAINGRFEKLSNLTEIKVLIDDLIANSEDLCRGLFYSRMITMQTKIEKNVDLSKTVAIGFDFLKSDDYYKDTWEIQRWGFKNQDRLVANVFAPCLILETLSENGMSITENLNFILGLKNGSTGSWFYYSNSTKLPTDADVLGQLLNIVSKDMNFKNYNMLTNSLSIIEKNIEPSGKCPTWLSDENFTSEENENLFGNECIGVMANLYYGLYLFDHKKYKDLILKGAEYILNSYNETTKSWVGSYYNKYYTFYLVSRLLNVLEIKDERLEKAKVNLLKHQHLNGSWNDSPQDTASVLLGLNTFENIDRIVYQTALIYLDETQKYDGSWSGENLYPCPGKYDSMSSYKNDKVTTAICLRAVLMNLNKI